MRGLRQATILGIAVTVIGTIPFTAQGPPDAIPHSEKIHPETTQARFGRIRIYLQAHRVNEALRVANQLSAEMPNDPQLHFSLGILLASQQQYKPAQLELEKANALQPGNF